LESLSDIEGEGVRGIQECHGNVTMIAVWPEKNSLSPVNSHPSKNGELIRIDMAK